MPLQIGKTPIVVLLDSDNEYAYSFNEKVETIRKAKAEMPERNFGQPIRSSGVKASQRHLLHRLAISLTRTKRVHGQQNSRKEDIMKAIRYKEDDLTYNRNLLGHADIEKVVSEEKIRQLSRSIMDVLWFSLWNKAK